MWGVVCRRRRHVAAVGQYESQMWWWARILLCCHWEWSALRNTAVQINKKLHKTLRGSCDNESTFVFMVQILECLLQFFFCLIALMLFVTSLALLAVGPLPCYGNRKNTLLFRTRRREWCHFGLSSKWFPYFQCSLCITLLFPYDFSRNVKSKVKWHKWSGLKTTGRMSPDSLLVLLKLKMTHFNFVLCFFFQMKEIECRRKLLQNG